MAIRNLSIIALLLNISLSDFVNSETGWTYTQSVNQAFYYFEILELDGVVAIGNGCVANESNAPECVYCFENIGSCDVVGAFFNGVCVGWVYADSSGYTTVPVMGSDGGEYSEDYPSVGDQISFIIYDSSEDQSYDLNTTCQEEGDCSWANFGQFIIEESDYTLNNDNNIIPSTYNILNAYPNPFNPSLNIDFSLESPGIVDIEIYDIMGNLVDSIISSSFTSSGNHSVVWNADNFASGEYLIRFKIDEVVFATRMVAYVK